MGSDLVRVRPHSSKLKAGPGSFGPAEAVIAEWLDEADAEAVAIVERAHRAAAAVKADALDRARGALARAEEEAQGVRESAFEGVRGRMDEAALAAEALRAEAQTEAAALVDGARESVAGLYRDIRDLRHELAQVFDPNSDLVGALGRAAATLGELCGQADRALPPGPVTPALGTGAGPPLALPPEVAPAGGWRRLLPGRLTRRAA